MDEKQSPNFYAVIPATVRYAKIPSGAKLLYGEISSLCNKEGYCWATNSYFANLYACEERTIIRWLNALRNIKMIKAMIPLRGGPRRIYLVSKFSTGGDKNVREGVTKMSSRGDKNVIHNIKSNNKSNNTCRFSDENLDSEKNEIKKIYQTYLQKFEKSENQYKLTPARAKKIDTRLKDAGAEMLERAIVNTSQSAFHRGENDRGWKADLDWIIRSYEQVEKLANMNPIAKPEENLSSMITPSMRRDMEEYEQAKREWEAKNKEVVC